ncbi:MAG TPA: hypothetical protein VEY33_15850 [Gemmatimonadota bacterium]|nr:hypothetical protein [Gemmatimonadota bacterium]
MVEKTRKKVSAKTLAKRYEGIDTRTERLDRLCDLLPGAPDPLEAASREELVARSEWASLDTRRRNRAVGFVRRSYLLARHMIRPPATYLRSIKDEPFDKSHLKAIKLPKVPFRYKDVPMAALAPKGVLMVAPLLSLVPRLVSTPTEDLPVILNSRLFHFYWQHYYPKKSGAPAVPAENRLAAFEVPMLTLKTGRAFREVRDRLLELVLQNSDRLAAMDEVHRIAVEARVPLVPIARTEGIIREINVPRPLSEVADVKRRGPVVIFRRGSTIVTTTEEAATYLELWLKQRFNELRGMSKEELEMFIKLPVSTAHVVVVLQHRARIEAEIERAQSKIEELQAQAESHLYDLYGMSDAEREYLRAAYP